MTSVKFQVLDVGQGMGHFVEIYGDPTDATKLTNTILIDFGSDHEEIAAGGPSVTYVTNKLKSMRPQPTIDLLLLSHGDTDHHNLLRKLLKNFDEYDPGAPTTSMLYVKKAFFGGKWDLYGIKEPGDKKKTNTLTMVSKYMDTNQKPQGFKCYASSFYDDKPIDPGKVKPWQTVRGLDVHMILGNCWSPAGHLTKKQTKPKNPGDFLKNTVSLVVLVTAPGGRFAVCGDATSATMAAIHNKVITDKIKDAFFDDVFLVTAPHHGAARTAFDIKLFQGASEDNVKEFAEKIGGQTIIASAERATHNHPAWKLLNCFVPKLLAPAYYTDPRLQGGRHSCTVHFTANQIEVSESGTGPPPTYQKWPTAERYATVQTAANIYTNLYSVPGSQEDIQVPPVKTDRVAAANPPNQPLGVAWSFRIASDRTKTLVPETNRAALTAALLARLAAQPPVLPPPTLPAPTASRRFRVFP